VDVKTFSVKNRKQKENRHFPKTMRTRQVPAQTIRLTAEYTTKNTLTTVKPTKD
jgi:hypothetical protein